MMIRDIFHDCISKSQSPLDPKDGEASHDVYGHLFLAACALLYSRFLKELINDPRQKEVAEKLKRRLLKVCQYYDGIDPLIKSAKRWFPDRTSPYCWANVTDSIREGTVDISLHAEDALLRVPQRNIMKGDMDVFRHNFPAMFERWQHIVHPCLHAELRVILHLDPPSSTRVLEPRAIGCSNRSCLCCMLWITSFNDTLGRTWMTSGSHGKPDANWALPGAPYELGANRRSRIDEDVCFGVRVRLRNAIDKQVLSRRASDQYLSSDDEDARSRRTGWAFLQFRDGGGEK
jgi:hypothetical protein